MRIAILGTRGIPASYGGFETFAEELGARLAARGHDVTVYGRPRHVPPGVTTHRGARVVVLPTIRHKYLDTVAHTFVSALHAAPRRFDVVLLCNAANAAVSWIPRLAGTRVVLNVDGIERRRRKWNALGRAWYLVSERLATWLPDAVVTDARVIEAYYRDRYRCPTRFIPYGSDLTTSGATDVLTSLGLEPGRYYLYVSRLEPENNAHAVIAGFERAKEALGGRRLAIVGDAPYAGEYIASLKAAAGPLVTFTGAIYGDGYRQLQSHAFAYIHATEVGGTHPALVEAMGAGNCAIVNDVAENREAAGDAVLYFSAADPESLASALRRVDRDPDLVADLRARAKARAGALYSWDAVTDEYERLFNELTGRSG